VRHSPPSPRALTAGVLAAALAAATPAAATPAAAQIAGVVTTPRRRPVDPTVAASPDSATRAGRTSARTPAQEVQRLDIQAWVDSAAGALARSEPPAIPPPGAGGRPSIFAEPAVPDSIRPGTAAPAPRGRVARPRRTRP